MQRNHYALLPTYIGAAISFLLYIAIGAVPGVLYGGYMGLVMAGALFGSTMEPTTLVRIVTGGGMVLGLLASMFFFLVSGAFVGTIMGMPFAKALRRMAEKEPATETVKAES